MMEQPPQRYSWWIIGIIVFAAIMRLNNVTQPFTDTFSWRQSDVAMIAEHFYQGNWNIFLPASRWNGPEPTYEGKEFQTVSYITALLYVVLGHHDVLGRLVAITFGVWGVYALYQLTKRVWDIPRALASAALLAVTPGAVFTDRSFVPDPAMVALCTTTLWMWVAYLQSGKRRYLALATIVAMWAFATKIPGLLIALPAFYAAGTILGWNELRRPKRLFCFIGLALVVIGPVAGYYLWQREVALTHPPYHFAGGRNWIWMDGIASWIRRRYFLDSYTTNLTEWIWTPPVIVLVIVGLVVPPKGEVSENSSRASWLYHFWAAGCIFYYLIGARELSENVWNFHLFNPPAAALAGQSLVLLSRVGSSVLRSPSVLARVAIILAVVVSFSLSALTKMYNPSHANDGYELGLALKRVSAPEDLVVTMANDLADPVAIYYSGRRGWVFPPPHPIQWWNKLPPDDQVTIELLEELRSKDARWFGFVRQFRKESWKGHEPFFAHLNQVCDAWVSDPRWVICRLKPADHPNSHSP